MAKNGAKIGYQQKQLVKYRVHIDGLSGDSVSRVEREIDAFERVRQTIEMTPKELAIVDRRIAGLEADMAVEQGKSFLLKGDYREAEVAFRVANRHRRSLKLSVITLFTRLAPRTLLKFYTSARASDIVLVPKHN